MDIFNCIKKPKVKEYRVVSCIDKIYKLKKFSNSDFECYLNKDGSTHINKLRVNDGCINYLNIILMAKINFMEAMNYYKLSKEKDVSIDKKESYDFLCRMLLEDVVGKLYAAYDRSHIILNDVFDLKFDSKAHNDKFKENVRDAVKKKNRKVGNRLNSIFSRLEKLPIKKDRINIVHNFSVYLDRIDEDENPKKANYCEAPSIDKIIENIEKMCEILEENVILLNTQIEEKFC